MSCEQPCTFCEPEWYANSRVWPKLVGHETEFAYVGGVKYGRRKVRICRGCFERIMTRKVDVK